MILLRKKPSPPLLLLLWVGMFFPAVFVNAQATNGDPENGAPAKRAAHHLLSLMDASGQIASDGLQLAQQQRSALIAARRTKGGSETGSAGLGPDRWVELGPDNVGGRIRTIAVHPTIPSRIFAGAASGGIWRSEDYGVHWEPISDVFPSLSITSIVFSPGNPNIIYASTGEGITGVPGAGIYKSTDSGQQWAQLPATLPIGPVTSSSWAFINRLSIHATNPNILIAAVGAQTISIGSNNGGLRVSTDAGITWTTRGPVDRSFCDVKFDPWNAGRVVAGTCTRSLAYYSTDNGANWTASNFAGFADNVELEYARSVVNLVYAKSRNKIFKSTNMGIDYSLVSANAQISDGQPTWNTALWVDPTNSSHLILGSIYLYRSVDGGVSFAALPNITSGLSQVPHPDQHVIASEPGYDGVTKKRLYFGNDGGIAATDDIAQIASGASNLWKNLSGGLRVSQFYSGSGRGDLIIGGTQDNGTQKWVAGREWLAIGGGDGGMTNVSRTAANYMFVESQYMAPMRATENAGLGMSVIFCGGLTEGFCSQNSGGLFIAPQVLDTNNNTRLWTGGYRLWRNDAVQGAVPGLWQAVNADGANIAISAIAAADGNSSHVWYADSAGRIFRSTNAISVAPVFANVTPKLPNGSADLHGQVTSLLIDKSDLSFQTVYATYSGYQSGNVRKTTNGGQSWQSIQSNLPNAPILWITRHPIFPQWLYVATEVGVFSSNNGGTDWTTTSEGPGNVRVSQLSWTDNWTLLAATYGRGMFRANTRLLAMSFSLGQYMTTVGTPFPSAPTVRVLDVDGTPLANVPVNFSAIPASNGSSASFASSSVLTNVNGYASAAATANTVASSTSPNGYSLQAAVSLSGTQNIASVGAFNTAGPLVAIAVPAISSPQSTPVNTMFPRAIRARAVDAFSNGIGNKEIAFVLPSTGASAMLPFLTRVTDADGWTAPMSATANAIPGSYVATLSIPGLGATNNISLTNFVGPDLGMSVTHDSDLVAVRVTNHGTITSQPVVMRIVFTTNNFLWLVPHALMPYPNGCVLTPIQPGDDQLDRPQSLDCTVGTIGPGAYAERWWINPFPIVIPVNGQVTVSKLMPSVADGDALNDEADAQFMLD